MAITVTPNLSTIYTADSETGWSGGTLNTDDMIEGTGCLAENNQAAVDAFMYDYQGQNGTTLDLSNTTLYSWGLCTNYIALHATAGIRIRVSDGTNYGEWNVGGSDTYGGGWKCFAVYTGKAFDANDGADPNLAAITQVGIVFNTVVKYKNVQNIFWDICRYGTGLAITGGTSSVPGTFSEIVSADDTNSYGVISEQDGVFFCQGKLVFGDTASADCYFADQNQVVVFPDRFGTENEFFGIDVLGNTTGTTDVQFGTVSNNVGGNGCYFRGNNNSKPQINGSGANIDVFHLYGCTLQHCGQVILDQQTNNVLSTTFINCNLIQPNQVTFDQNVVSACEKTQALSLPLTHYVTNTSFNSNVNAILISAIGTYNFNGIIFSGNTYDVENASTGLVTINVSDGDSPTYTNTNGGSVAVNNNVSVTLTGMKDNTEVRVYEQGTTNELAGTDNATTGTIDNREFTFSLSAGTSVDIRIFNIDWISTNILNYTVPSSSASLPVTQVTDRVYANPV